MVRMVRMVRMVVVQGHGIVVVLRSVVVPTNWGAAAVEFAVATFACGTFGVGVGGSDGGGLHEQGCADLSHRAAQLEEEQQTCEHRVAGCIDSDGIWPESPESPGSTSR